MRRQVTTRTRSRHAALGRSWGCTGENGPSYLLRDTFTDANGTALASHTMDVGAGWTVHAGSFDIQSNQANSATTAECVATADAGRADCTISATVLTPSGAPGQGLVMRATDASNYWTVGLHAPSNIRLYEKNVGSYTERASASFAWSTGVAYTLRAVLSGASIICTVDGGTEISYGSATFNQSATRHGIRQETVSNVRFDDFEVTA